MERRVRTGSGFRAQGAVERKFPNRNPNVTDWFRLEGTGSGNFTRERIGNVTTVGTDENIPGIGRSETHISHPFRPLIPPLLSIFIVLRFRFALRLESERMVRIGA